MLLLQPLCLPLVSDCSSDIDVETLIHNLLAFVVDHSLRVMYIYQTHLGQWLMYFTY